MEKLELKNLDTNIYYEKLSNGLDVYLIPNPNVVNFYMTFNTRFGSLYTKFKNNGKSITVPNGVAHFLEHLTFKLEDGNDASDMFASLGSFSNAFTSYDVTCYEVTGSSKFNENLCLLLDYVQTPCYDNEVVEAEKGIITSEVRMYEDDPFSALIASSFENTLHKHHMKYRISGSVEEVENTTLKDINNAYDTFYHPSNMFVIISGNFNPEEAMAIIEENQTKKEFKDAPKIEIKKENEKDSVVKEYDEVTRDVEIDKVSFMYKLPLGNFNYLNLSKFELTKYIEIIINSKYGATSELKEKLVNGNIIKDYIYYNVRLIDDHVLISVSCETDYPSRLITILKEESLKDSLNEKDFNRKKNVITSNLIRVCDDVEKISYEMLKQIISYGDVNYNMYDDYQNLNYETASKIADELKNSKYSITVMKKKEN